jgi:hypothetical protein
VKRVLLLAAAGLIALIGAIPVQAADRFGAFVIFNKWDDVILLDGEIDSSTPAEFRKALAARPKASVLILSSPGGVVPVALKLAAEIRRHKLSTAIPKGIGCYSACAYLFFAGRDRAVRGELGVHQVSSAGRRDRSGAAVYEAQVKAELARYGVPGGVLTKMLETSPDSMHVFSAKEIAALSINRGGKGSRASVIAAQ